MPTSEQIRNELKDAFREFSQKAKTWMENETGIIPEEHKEFVRDSVRTQVENAMTNDKTFIDMVKRVVMNTDEDEEGNASPRAWFNDRMEEALDEMMCRKTRQTIEEYNLVSFDNLADQINEYDFSSHEESVVDSVIQNIHENISYNSAIEEHVGDLTTAFKNSDELVEQVAQIIKDIKEDNPEGTDEGLADKVLPIVREEISKLLEDNIQVKAVVKTGLMEVLRDVIR